MEDKIQVIVAKTAGFCFGVERAVNQVYQQIESGVRPIYTLGPIIHNEEVVKDLEQKGVRVISREEIRDIHEGTVIIRSHGVGRQVYEELEKQGVHIVDATCPFVKKIHHIVEEQNRAGRRIIIIGDSTHPEVEGIRGWADNRTLTAKTEEEIDSFVLKKDEKICFVAQTTFNYKKFKYLVEKFSKKGYDIIVFNSICSATEERQKEAERIASQVDAMIVIGGKSSSNTRKLYEICKMQCGNTHFIQTLDDLQPESGNSVRSVGITAGASTPKNIIEEVHTNVRTKF